MDYRRVYTSLTSSRKLLDRVKPDAYKPGCAYYEEHHICPVALGGGNEDSNLVLLTAREHFVAHWLLTKFTKGTDYYKVLNALVAMSMLKSGRRLTSRQYERCKIAAQELNAGLVLAGKHNFQSDGFRAYKSDFQRQIVHCHCGKTGQRGGMAKAHGKNCKVKPQLALALQLAGLQPGNWLNVSNDIATIKAEVQRLEAKEHTRTLPERQLKAKQGKSERAKIKVTCPWCGKTGNKPPMHAHHFDNCLLHPTNAGLTRAQIRAKV